MYVLILILKDQKRLCFGPFTTEARCEEYAKSYPQENVAAQEIEPLIKPFRA